MPTAHDSGFQEATTTNRDFTPRYVAVGNQPITLACADLDGDGRLDLVTANSVGNSITVVLDPGGTAPSTREIAAGTQPSQVVLGNFAGGTKTLALGGLDLGKPTCQTRSGTGAADIAVLNAGDNTVSVYLADGLGGWNAPTTYALDGAATQLQAVRLKPTDPVDALLLSLAVDSQKAVGGSDSMLALVNDGSGSFTLLRSPAGTAPGRFVTGDWNGDGKLDVAVLNPGSAAATVLLGDGAGAFTPASAPNPPGIGTAPFDIVTGDFDSDGKPDDLAVSNDSGPSVSILLGQGDGTFALAPGSPFEVGVNPRRLFRAAPGSANLVVAHDQQKFVSLLTGGGTTGQYAATELGTGTDPFAAAAGRFAGSNSDDLAVVESQQRLVSIFANNGSGGYSRSVIGFASAVQFPMTGDFNGDGKDDLVLLQPNEDRLVLLLNLH